MTPELSQVIVAGIGLVAAWLAYRAKLGVMAVQKDVTQVSTQIDAVHQTFNSKMDKLLEVVAAKAYAEGVLEGRAAQVSDLRIETAKAAEITAAVEAAKEKTL